MTAGWKILLVEDSRAEAELLRASLRGASPAMEVIWVERLAQAMERIPAQPFDAILLDLTLPDGHGLKTLHRMREAAGAVPIIVLTGLQDEEAALGAVRQGAQDYLVKGSLDGAGIARAIRYAIDRKKQEEDLRRLNRTLRALSRSSQAMVRASQEPELLEEVCRIVVEDCGHALAWIGFALDDDAKTVRPVAQAGTSDGYVESLLLTWADEERGRGPTGTAIRTRVPAVCAHIESDPRFAAWREQALSRGFASSIAIPLLADDTAFGALMIYSRMPDPFSEDEVRLLTELADDLSYGIRVIRLRAAHQRSEEALQASERQFRAFFELAAVGMAQADPESGRLLRVNAKLCEITGYSADDLLGMRFIDITHPEDRERDWEGFQKAVRGDIPDHRSEKRFVRKDGQSVWVNVNAAMIRDSRDLAVRTAAVIEDISDRKAAEARLKQSLEEKEVLLKEIHHRVKNNLQLIASMLNLQAAAVRDEADRLPLLESQNRVRSLALLHEKLYRSGDLANVPFREYASDLSAVLVRTLGPGSGQIGLELSLEEVRLGVSTAIPLALILNELLSNALKHAFPGDRAGRIRVTLRSVGPRSFELAVEDDGVGFPDGLDIRKAESLGLQLVSVLAEQVGGTVDLRREAGSRIAIQFEEGA